MAQTGVLSLKVNTYPNGIDNTQRRQVLTGVATIASPGSAAAGTIGAVTAYSITSNVITLTAVNSLATGGGQQVTLSAFPTSTFLNGVNLTVTSATGTSIVAAFTHANVGATTEAGVFTLTPQYLTNGIPLSWVFTSQESGGSFIPNFSATTPVDAQFYSLAGNVVDTYLWDPVHATLRIAVSGTEVTTATAVPVDTIGFKAEFVKGV